MTTHKLRAAGSRVATLAVAVGTLTALALLPISGAMAAGCEGQNATGDSGGRSVDLATRTQEEVLERAKSNAGVNIVPTFAGVAVSGSRLDHDGYRLKSAIPQIDCAGAAIAPITRLSAFTSESVSVSGVGEIDVTRQFGLPSTSLLKLGMGVGGKWLDTNFKGTLRTPAAAATGGPGIGINAAGGKVEEAGVQLDFYSLLAMGQTYFTVATSIGFGDTQIKNASFVGQEFVVLNTPGATRTAVFGGGRGSTDYQDYTISGGVGHVFTLGVQGNARYLLDVNGGLLYAHYTRDGLTDTAGVRYSDANTEEFAGKVEAKLAVQVQQGSDVWTPYVKAGIKQRFDYSSSVTVFNPSTGLCAIATGCDFTARYSIKGDDTFWRVGGGLGAQFKGGHTGLFEIMHQGAGDSSEITGKAQLILKLN